MNTIEALRVFGTGRLTVQWYGSFAMCDINGAMDAIDRLLCESSKIYKLVDDSETGKGVILVETIVDDENNICETVYNSFDKFHLASSCLASMCLFDGIFRLDNGFFLDDASDQTYAFCMNRGLPTVSFDEDVLSSDGWRGILHGCREAILGGEIDKA